jgi:hypothetical protein
MFSTKILASKNVLNYSPDSFLVAEAEIPKGVELYKYRKHISTA